MKLHTAACVCDPSLLEQGERWRLERALEAFGPASLIQTVADKRHFKRSWEIADI